MPEIEIILPALLAAAMIAITHAPLGIEVLKRGIIFIDLAVAQIAGLGLVISSIYLDNNYAQIITLLFALTACYFFYMVERLIPKFQEAIIGCCFILSSSIALIILSHNSLGSEEIKHMLSGQILFITYDDLLKHFPVYLIALALWFSNIKFRSGLSFYLIFAAAITSSVQLVGVYLVFASLIIPALASVNKKHPNFFAMSFGLTSVTLGSITSYIYNFPTGAFTVISYFIILVFVILVQQVNFIWTNNH